MKRLLILMLILSAPAVNAEMSQANQIYSVCSAALLYTSQHPRTSDADETRYIEASIYYMKKLPKELHYSVDVVLTQLVGTPYSEIKRAADNCASAAK